MTTEHVIIALTDGFVFHGKCSIDESTGDVNVTSVVNIRVWGTTNGLGELALKGPTKATVLDKCGDLIVPARRIVFRMKCSTIWKIK